MMLAGGFALIGADKVLESALVQASPLWLTQLTARI
jgi:hypothetical protein